MKANDVIGYAVITPDGQLSGLYTAPPEALPEGFTVQEAVLRSAAPEVGKLTDEQIMNAACTAADALDATRVSEMRAGGWHATTIFDGDSGLLRFGRLIEQALRSPLARRPVAWVVAVEGFGEGTLRVYGPQYSSRVAAEQDAELPRKRGEKAEVWECFVAPKEKP